MYSKRVAAAVALLMPTAAGLVGCGAVQGAQDAVVSEWILGSWSCEVIDPTWEALDWNGLRFEVTVGDGTWEMVSATERTKALLGESSSGTWEMRFGELSVDDGVNGGWSPLTVFGIEPDEAIGETGSVSKSVEYDEGPAVEATFDIDGSDLRITQGDAVTTCIKGN